MIDDGARKMGADSGGKKMLIPPVHFSLLTMGSPGYLASKEFLLPTQRVTKEPPLGGFFLPFGKVWKIERGTPWAPPFQHFGQVGKVRRREGMRRREI